MIAKHGTPAPGTSPSAIFTDFRSGFALNNAGRTAFIGQVSTPTGGFTGVWSNASGNLELIAREGSPAPSTTLPAKFWDFRSLSLDDSGRVAFVSAHQTSPQHLAVWRGDSHDLSLIASTITQAPDMPPGTVFHWRSGISLTSNRSGQLALVASVTDNPVGFTTTGGGLWSDRSGPLSLVLAIGDEAPTGSPGETYADLTFNLNSSSMLNNLGQMALRVGLAGPNVTTTNNSAIVLEHPNSAEVLHRTGDAAPGAAPGSVFRHFFYQPDINDSAEVAFAAHLNSDSANDTGVWTGAKGQLKLIAREGSPAPGVPADVTFADWGASWDWDSLSINSLGQVAFVAQVQGGGVTTANDLGIWATDLAGNLLLIAREGDSIEVAPNDHRIIAALNEIDFAHVAPVALNNKGQIAIHARLVDGYGIFVSNAVAVPEPVTALPVQLLLSFVVSYRCRRP